MTRKPTNFVVIKSIEAGFKRFDAALVKENLKLQKRIASQEAHMLSLENQIKVLKGERKANEPPSRTDMLDAARRIAFVFAQAGMHIVDSNGEKVKPY